MESELAVEVERASEREANAYLLGASRDGTINRHHNTLRISQGDRRWLDVLQELLASLGYRSWQYREGTRNVWVLETCFQPESSALASTEEQTAFVRGYFDAEGGIPRKPGDRFYIQFVQKDFADLRHVHEILAGLGLACGRLHNPSIRIDPDYWRFYVLRRSHLEFASEIGSWHPRKRDRLEVFIQSEKVAC